jgi:hypothetical protein
MIKIAIIAALFAIIGCSGNEGDSELTPSSSSVSSSSGYETLEIGIQTWMLYDISGLYDWATAMNLSSSCNSTSCAGQVQAKHQGICPDGFHIPTRGQFNTLLSNSTRESLSNLFGVTSTSSIRWWSTTGYQNSANSTWMAYALSFYAYTNPNNVFDSYPVAELRGTGREYKMKVRCIKN